MQAKIEQLLKDTRLHPVYLLAGDEPFQKLKLQDRLRGQARAQGFDERRSFDFSDGKADWPALADASQSLGLFSQRQLIELNLGEKRPDKSGVEVLTEVVARTGDDLLLVVSMSQLAGKKDEGTAWYQALDKAGVVVRIWPVTHQELPGHARSLLADAGLNADADALELLVERSEGNLLALAQEIEKLSLLRDTTSTTPLTADIIRASVTDSSRFTVFDLTAAMARGDARRSLRILDHLRDEGEAASLLLWQISRELQVMEASSSGQPIYTSMPRAHLATLEKRARQLGSAHLQSLLALAFDADTRIKGQSAGDAWNALASLVLGMAGAPLPVIFNR